MQSLISSKVKNKEIYLGYLLIYLLFIITMPDAGPGGFDRICFTSWANYIYANGLQNIYKFGIDYLPLYHYFLYLYGKIQGSPENIIININSLKYITALFDILGAIYVFKLTKKLYISSKSAFLASLLLLLNVAYLYNNLFYGQVDGIYTCMLFMAFYYAFEKKIGLSILLMLLSINFKLQAIIFLPLFGLMLLPEILEKITLKNLSIWIVPSLVVQTLILLPYTLAGDLPTLIFVIKNSMGKYPLVSMGAYNIWVWVLENPSEILDKRGIWGRSYNRIGLLLFSITLLFTLWPLIKSLYERIIKKANANQINTEKILLMASITPIIFFYFNTQMHSRYTHPAIIFSGAYAIYTRRPLVFILISIACFLNVEGGIKIIKGDILPYQYFFFQPKFVSALFLTIIGILFYELYRKPKILNANN